MSVEDAQAYADEENLLFLETSAKTGVNVSEVFERLAGRLPKTEAQLASSRAFGTGSRLDLTGRESTQPQRACC